MRILVLSVAATLAFAGASVAQTTEVIRGNTSGTHPEEGGRRTGRQVRRPQDGRRGPYPAARWQTNHRQAGRHQTAGDAPELAWLALWRVRAGAGGPGRAAAPLDLTSPRSLSLLNVNSTETLTVTYWSDGAYHRDALDKLNQFLRDSQSGDQTEMDPLVFDVLWHTMQQTGYGGTVEVLSAFRSPEHNAWLASVSRGVARDSQHMNGNAMDVRFPGVPVFKIRQAARSLQMGGVGFYPRSGFVHLDTGPVRYW